jgi:hypothetical protein
MREKEWRWGLKFYEGMKRRALTYSCFAPASTAALTAIAASYAYASRYVGSSPYAALNLATYGPIRASFSSG